jgi:hypothetical protein
MYTGLGKIYEYRSLYCLIRVMYDETEWWKFSLKRALKRHLDCIYPLMVSETKAYSNPMKGLRNEKTLN